jgi:hypothetical protein
MSNAGGDSGGNFFETLNTDGNFFENVLNDVINLGVQYSTYGLVGVKDGKVTTGVTSGTALRGMKEITGAKAAEDANKLARDQFENSKAEALAQREESVRQTGREQLQQSRTAGAARATAQSTTNRGQAFGSFSLGGDEKDFLGL